MKGIVYEIYSDSHPDIRYVGSTTQTLEMRWTRHKNHFKERREGNPIICKYFEEFGIDNFKIRVIKEYDIVDSKHLLAYEQLWINKLKTINFKKNLFPTKMIKQMQQKLYREEHKEDISEQRKLYCEENKESISEYHQKYYENNKKRLREYNQTYREDNKDAISEQRKLYYEENKESISEKNKLYRENNREKIREKKQRTYICPCEPDKEKNYEHKARHERTIKHQKYLQSLEEKKE